MVNTQLKILRVFGPTGAEVSSVLRQIRDDGCPGLRLLERDGEFAICVQVSAPNRAMAEQYCDKWAARLRAKFGDDVFAEGETSLAQATLDALLDKRKLLVAVDETTGRLLGALLQPLAHSEAVFDFGTESYADPQKARRIAVPEQLLKRFPGDVVQAAAGRALAAMQVTGADYAAAYMPASVGQCPFVLVCDRRGAVACALPPDMNDTFIANQILDLLRRRLFQQIPEGFAAAIANPLIAFQIKMVAALFGCQPYLVQRFLAVDNDFAAIFKGNGQYAAVDFAVDIAVAIPVVQAFFNGQPELISQAMKFTVVHCCILFLSDGGSIAVWGQGFKVCTSAAAFRHDSSVTGIMMSLF